jgi:hypothetical protein
MGCASDRSDHSGFDPRNRIGLRGLFAHSAPRPFSQYSITQATKSGTARLTVISPDGKYLLFARRENGLESLWLRNVPTASDTQVVAPSAARPSLLCLFLLTLTISISARRETRRDFTMFCIARPFSAERRSS